ncbi:hypothetical protein, partial [Serinicoccus kebangsaanensis]|uniref:hypothetical protein n=1 Tax=Serinicoccus kebangsaanensis TaxID=2602069 RepID=UPI00178C423C
TRIMAQTKWHQKTNTLLSSQESDTHRAFRSVKTVPLRGNLSSLPDLLRPSKSKVWIVGEGIRFELCDRRFRVSREALLYTASGARRKPGLCAAQRTWMPT